MNPHQLKRFFPNASAETIRRNGGDYGTGKPDENNPNPSRIPDAEQRQQPPPLARGDAGEAPRARRPHVCFILRRVQLLDADAKYGSCKDLLDGLRIAGLIRGDREKEITLEVRQEKVPSYAKEETVIEVDL